MFEVINERERSGRCVGRCHRLRAHLSKLKSRPYPLEVFVVSGEKLTENKVKSCGYCRLSVLRTAGPSLFVSIALVLSGFVHDHGFAAIWHLEVFALYPSVKVT